MKKKEVVIVIPGTKGLVGWPHCIRGAIRFFAKLLGLVPAYVDNLKFLVKVNNGNNLVLDWRRGIDPVTLFIARRRLKKLLLQYSDYKVKIVAFSLGGKITLDVLFKNEFNNIYKIILVGTVNNHKNLYFKNIKVINIYSPEDDLIDFAIKVYAPINGSKIINGENVKNIKISNIKHHRLCANCTIKEGKYKGKNILQLIDMFLKD